MFTQEFIEAACARVLSGEAASRVAADIGVHHNLVLDWAKERRHKTKPRKPRAAGVRYLKSYMVDRRNEDGSIEQVSIEVLNGEWPKGTFTVRRRKAVYAN
jgi:hypothetical protein